MLTLVCQTCSMPIPIVRVKQSFPLILEVGCRCGAVYAIRIEQKDKGTKPPCPHVKIESWVNGLQKCGDCGIELRKPYEDQQKKQLAEETKT